MKEILDETIAKISETKSETGRQKTIDGFVKNDIPEQSDTKLAIPSHRTREWISFEEFKGFIKKGDTLKGLRQKYSKHLIQFYSYLSQGNISLTKEQFTEEYDKGISLNEIAKSHNIPREHITYLREFYGIKRKGATYQKRLAKEIPLSQDAKDIIIGSLLGDGHITKWGYFSEKHSPAQLEYLKWKASFFKDITTDKSWDYYEAIDKRSGSLIKTHCFRTTAHSFLYEMRNKFYKPEFDGWRKIIPDDIADMMNEKVLAIWFMDDGCTDWMYRNGEKEWEKAKPMTKICTDSFSEKDIAILTTVLSLKFGIKGYMRDKRDRNRIIFDTDNTSKFLELTKKHAHTDLLYKFDEKVYSERTSLK